MDHKPQALSCAAAPIFLQLYWSPLATFLFPALSSKCSLAVPSSIWPCGSRCNSSFVMLSSLLRRVCPSRFHFPLLSWDSTSWSVFLHNFRLLILSGQCIFTIIKPRTVEKGAINVSFVRPSVCLCVWLSTRPSRT